MIPHLNSDRSASQATVPFRKVCCPPHFASLLALGIALLLPMAVRAEDTAKRNFNLAADTAEKSLKLLAAQSGIDVVLATEAATRVRTNAVHGKFSTMEAATRMLEGTDLVVEQDAQTHALVVGRKTLIKPPAANTRPTDQAEPKPSDEVTKLETFRVTTDLGRYAEERTTAGSKTMMETKDLPASVQIFNLANIKDRLADNLDDVYPYITGAAKEAPIDTGFSIRGFTAQGGGGGRTVQIDSLPGSLTSYSSPSTVNVERLEVLKGATSILYGKLNPGGLINIVTKVPKQTAETEVSASIRSYEGNYSTLGEDMGYKFTVDKTGPIDAAKHWLYRVIVSIEDINSWRPGSFSRDFYLYPSLTYKWSAQTSFTAQVEVMREKRRYDNGIPFPPLSNPANLPEFDRVYQDKDAPDRDAGESLSTHFVHTLANGWMLVVNARSLHHQNTGEGYRTNQTPSALTIRTPITDTTLRRRYFRKIITKELNFVDANIQGDFGSEKLRHTMLAGINVGLERRNSDFPISANASATGIDLALSDFVNYYNPVLGLSPIPAPGVLIAPRITGTNYINYGVYVSDRMKIGHHWNLHLGVRTDGQDSESNEYTRTTAVEKKGKIWATLPTAGLVFQPNDRFSYYISTNRSFKPAAVDSNVDASGRVDFPPETGIQYEFGVKTELADKRFTAALAVYQIVKKNVLTSTGTFTPDGLPISMVQGKQQSQGVELEGTWLPMPNFQLQGGISVADAKTTVSTTPALVGRRLVGVPRISGNFWTRYNVPSGRLRGLGMGLGIAVKGNSLAGTPVTQATFYESPAWIRFDTAFYYQMKRSNIALNIANVLDRKYIASSGENAVFAGEPRRLTLSYRYRF
jgi:iron complex outermembrane receptor protein